ncbi:MAG: signal peptide peptidase SppA [Flavobacteriales bacterium]|nr:signal peptide peptidase SppA [Flavobacteriales bacterium]
MRPFWRSFWASTLAYIFLAFLGILTLVVIIWIAFDEKEYEYEEHSVLQMSFGNISELSNAEISFTGSNIQTNYTMGLREIKIALEAAEKDEKIDGIMINLPPAMSAGMATLEEIRNSILEFRESGKFVIAYADVYSQKGYYLASAANEVYLNPVGLVEFRGLGVQLMFFKGMIDKLGVDMQIIRGSNNKFKSAVEPFMLDSMSDANRKQTMTYLNAMWNQMLKGISKERGIDVAYLNEIADSLYVRSAETALSYKLVDGLLYKDEVLDIIKKNTKAESINEIEFLDFEQYAYHKDRDIKKENAGEDENIAVVYAVGGINSGKGTRESIGSETVSEAIRDARLDENIKAVVLRINSPGGDALASDVIWREVKLTKEVKPVIVSMGDVAASGGYYIACPADKIYAQPNTITGSIGVFGVIPNIGPMLEDKLGITIDGAKTNVHANSSLPIFQALTEEERNIIQGGVDQIYDDFTKKVAEGRGMTQAAVDSIGQGRVWAGTDALNIGLVDELGGIDDALYYAAEQAKIKKSDIHIKVYPEWDNGMMDFLRNMELGKEDNKTSSKASVEVMKMLNTIDEMSSMRGVQARLPYEIVIE